MSYNLDGKRMNVVETDPDGVVNSDTIFDFSQDGETVYAVYRGGKIEKGFLIGTLSGNKLEFAYCQKQTDGKIDQGISVCEVSIGTDSKYIIIEEFEWKSRPGIKGKNVFKEL
ncbi:MAG: hypothetical protein KDC42_11665 [Ignavibacteriae bacterium]|nr:hypothetical protein [Ignavibacteriota bacterium]